MNEENNTNKYTTEEQLDKKLGENNQVLLEAIDSLLSKQIKEVKEELYIVRNELNQKIDDTKDELKVEINNAQALIDGYVKAQEDFKQDFVIMKEESKQVKQIIKEKLGIEIRAI